MLGVEVLKVVEEPLDESVVEAAEAPCCCESSPEASRVGDGIAVVTNWSLILVLPDEVAEVESAKPVIGWRDFGFSGCIWFRVDSISMAFVSMLIGWPVAVGESKVTIVVCCC